VLANFEVVTIMTDGHWLFWFKQNFESN